MASPAPAPAMAPIHASTSSPRRPKRVRVLNESLGEGEVAIRITGHEDVRIQETVFAGVWRERHFGPDGTLRSDILEASPIPSIATDVARRGTTAAPLPVDLPPGAMNAPALLHEIAAQVRALRARRAAARPQPHAAAADARRSPLPRRRAAGRPGRDPVARLRQLPHHQYGRARRLARPVLQQHADADPQHPRDRRHPRGGARRRRGPRRQRRAPARPPRVDARVGGA